MRIGPVLALSVLSSVAPLGAQVARRAARPVEPLEVPAETPKDVGVDLREGTLGIGLEISKLVTPRLGLRAGANYFSISRTTTQSDVAYDATIKLQSETLLADFFPLARGVFHLTGGILANSTSAESRCASSHAACTPAAPTDPRVGHCRRAAIARSCAPTLRIAGCA